MTALAKDPTVFLSALRQKVRSLGRLREERQKYENDVVNGAVTEAAKTGLRTVLPKIRDLAVEIVDAYEELDEWLEGGGDAPSQWIEEKKEF